MNARALFIASIVGTVLQVAMVVAGHYNKSITGMFAVGGMGFSLVAGVIYVLAAKESAMSAALIGGLVAGGACAFLGILVSYLLGDVPMSLLALGTISSMVTGAIGGALGRWLGRAMGMAVAAP